jgi:HEAT repeat protein
LAVKNLTDADVSGRIASLRALAPLGGKEQVPGVLLALANTTDASERTAAEKALGGIGSRGGDEMLPLILDAMKGASPESRIVLLRVLARIGGPKALEAVLEALNDANAPISDEAVRLLSDWPTLDAVPHLLKLAQSGDLSRQVLGLRGYVRLAGIEPSTDEKARMLTKAMELAKRPDEKKLVLGAWGTLPTEQSLDTLRPHLDDAAVQHEAALAVIAVAAELGKNANTKSRASDALRAVIDKCADPKVRHRAQEALAPLQ